MFLLKHTTSPRPAPASPPGARDVPPEVVVSVETPTAHHLAALRWATDLAYDSGGRLVMLSNPGLDALLERGRKGGLVVVGTPGPASLRGRRLTPLVGQLLALYPGPVAVVPGLFRAAPDGPVLSTTNAVPKTVRAVLGQRPLVRVGSFAEMVRSCSEAYVVVLVCGPHARADFGACAALATLGSLHAPAIVVHPGVDESALMAR
jgi:hypothetical protein